MPVASVAAVDSPVGREVSGDACWRSGGLMSTPCQWRLSPDELTASERFGSHDQAVAELTFDRVEGAAAGDQGERLVGGGGHDRDIAGCDELDVGHVIVVLALVVVPDLDLIVEVELIEEAE